jgi:hypothetical protein
MSEITQAPRIKTIDFTAIERNPLYALALTAITLLAVALRFYRS